MIALIPFLIPLVAYWTAQVSIAAIVIILTLPAPKPAPKPANPARSIQALAACGLLKNMVGPAMRMGYSGIPVGSRVGPAPVGSIVEGE